MTSLLQACVRELFDYREDGALIRRYATGRNSKAGEVVGGVTDGYLLTRVWGVKRCVHRLVFLWHHGWLPKEVDHKDGNPLNNRVDNLRPATRSQNLCNTRLSRRNTSGIKGVSWAPRQKKWHAQCRIKPLGLVHLGYHSDIKDAEAAVRKFREEHHGEFANHGGGCV